MEKHLITTSDATGSEQPVEDSTFHSDPYFSRDSISEGILQRLSTVLLKDECSRQCKPPVLR